MATKAGGEAVSAAVADGRHRGVHLARCFSWSVVAVALAFILNNYLSNWREWPGPFALFEGGGTSAAALSAVQLALYLAAPVVAIAYVLSTRTRGLRPDSETIYAISAYIIRAAFWAVFFVGVADMIVSFLRVEGLLPALVGDHMTIELGRSRFRGVFVHFPMVALGMIVAVFHRGLGFPWLALLVVAAELLIVLTRFVFSYEQAFMADLVRFWYAALFLFASAYTLLEDGHVRVDVLYSTFDDRIRGLVNAVGSILLGLSLCVVVMYFGMEGRSSVINAPLLLFETTQTGFGMYVKYWMAGFLGIFAITMLLQFAGQFLESVADYRGDPGKRVLETEVAAAQ